MRRVYDLHLRRSTSPVFAMSFLATHTIEAGSPLHKLGAPALREGNANLVVTFTGIDDQLAATVHARYMWTWNDIVFDHKFEDVLRTDAQGKRYLDLAYIHDTKPIVTASAAGPASAE